MGLFEMCTDFAALKNLTWKGESSRNERQFCRVCPSIEFEFISTIMGQDFSVPIKPMTRLVANSDKAPTNKICRRAPLA